MLEATKKLIKQLEKATLPLEDRVALTTILLDKVDALPIENVIAVDLNGVYIDGKLIDPEKLSAFKDACIALNDNFARKLIHRQVKYLAIAEGIHNGLTLEQLYFSKAALWVLQKETELIEAISDGAKGVEE